MSKTKLHIEYPPVIDNVLMKFFVKAMPEFLLKKFVLKISAPTKRPLDIYEINKENPYKIVEVEEGKIWMVCYTRGVESPAILKSFGLGDDPKTYDKLLKAVKYNNAEDEMERVEKDWECWQKYLKMDVATGEKGGYNAIAASSTLQMSIVKLKSGSLLLFCPVAIHDDTEVSKLLQELGPVKYILVGASAHTLFIGEVVKRYPEAIVIGPSMAEEKLNIVGALPRQKFDYNTMDESSLQDLNDVLVPEGVKIHFTVGDIGTQTSFVTAYKTALEVDLIYIHHDQCSCNFCHDENAQKEDKWFKWRIFKWLLMAKPNSPFGYIPSYRFAMMDPTSATSQFTWPRPKPDGSSCVDMAESLRKYLRLDYENVISGHWGLMSSSDFKKTVDLNWNWLDGKALI